jgi:probable HAF family extracellular repeat protein
MNAMRLNGWTLAVILFACTTIPALAHDGCNIRYRLTDLGDLGGGFSFSEDMNDRGQVVGYSITSDGEPHAFLSSPAGGMSDLMPESDFSVAFGVNHRGQVVLNRTAASGEGEAIVWSPHRPVRILPTLGGERTSALGINNHGQVVGWSELTNGDQHAFLWTPGDDNLRDLGTLGGAQSAASDINESGEVVGHSNLSTGPEHAFRWSSRTGRMQDLGTLDGGFSDAEDINERGQVVGRVAEGGTSHAVSWSRRAEIRDLGTLGGSSSFAAGINNRRQVVGWSTTPPEPGFLDGPQHAFLWSPRCGMQDLNDLLVRETQVTLTLASAINNRGQIAADGELGNFTHAYRLTPLPEDDESAAASETGAVELARRFLAFAFSSTGPR